MILIDKYVNYLWGRSKMNGFHTFLHMHEDDQVVQAVKHYS